MVIFLTLYKDPRNKGLGTENLPFSSHFQQNAGKGICARAHYHELIEFLYCTKGSAQALLGNKEYFFSEGDLIMINSNEAHTIYALADNLDYIVVQFEPELLYSTEKSVLETGYILPFILSNYDHPRVVTKKELEKTPVASLVKNILKEVTEKEYGYELSVRADICNLFLWITRYWKKNDMLPAMYQLEQNAVNILKQAFDFVKENYSNNITTYDAADYVKLSYSYFSRLFKLNMGIGFTDYLNSVRISEAERLLVKTEKSMTDIAMDVGFSTSSYFILKFRQKNNISPLAYRKMFSNK